MSVIAWTWTSHFLVLSMYVNTGGVIERMLSRIKKNALSLLSLPGKGSFGFFNAYLRLVCVGGGGEALPLRPCNCYAQKSYEGWLVLAPSLSGFLSQSPFLSGSHHCLHCLP